MSVALKEKTTIGRSERADFSELGFHGIPVRIDTGAGISAIGVTSVSESPSGGLDVVFFDDKRPYYTGKSHHFAEFSRTEVRSSNGQAQERYLVRIQISIGGRKIRSKFTLADRSTQIYPVLIGRNTLRGKFVVDVKLGILLASEKQYNADLRARYGDTPKE